MHRYILTFVFLFALAACSSSGGGDGESAGTSTGAGSSTDASAPADASDAGSTGPAGEASAACTEAFAPIAEMNLESTSDLGDLAEVEATVENCESIDDWIAGAEAAVGDDVNPSTARLLLGIRCNDPGLSGSPICQELANS